MIRVVSTCINLIAWRISWPCGVTVQRAPLVATCISQRIFRSSGSRVVYTSIELPCGACLSGWEVV